MKLSPGVWTAETSGTTVSFTVSNFLVHRVTGTLSVRSATLQVDEMGTPTSVEAVLDAGSFHTGNSRRDQDIRSRRFLDAETHPLMAWRSSTIRPADEGWVVHGVLTVGGNRVPIDLVVSARGGDEALSVRARGTLDRRTAGIRAPAFLIGRDVDVEIECQLTTEASVSRQGPPPNAAAR